MNIKRSIKKLFKKKERPDKMMIANLYHTDYQKTVLICYITAPFLTPNHFKHQNYLTSHIVAESFRDLGYNVDIIEYTNQQFVPDYTDYAVIFGMGYQFERSFLSKNRAIPRIHLITGAHQDLHNEMSLRSISDFYASSGLWMPDEANVLAESAYYGMYNADVSIILARGYVFDDCRARFKNKLYSLNNNILGVFSGFSPKTNRTNNFLFLSGGRQVTKGLPILLEAARIRTDLIFYVVVPNINSELLELYRDVFKEGTNVFLFKDIRMDGEEMKNIIESCSYVVAPSYIDGLPGGTIEPMSAGLIPIVSKYCGFPGEKFIFEMDELSVTGLISKMDEVLEVTEETYLNISVEVMAYANQHFSKEAVKRQLIEILEAELK